MAEVIEVGLKVTGANKAKKAIEGTTKATNDLGGTLDSVTAGLDKFTGGAVSGFRDAATGVKSFIKGLKLTRAAIIATGIGALVVGVTGLVAAFAGTAKGADQLKQVMAGLGAVVDNLKQRFAAVGGFIVGLFQGGPTKALENYNDLTKDLSNNLGDVFRQAQQLEKDSQKLRDSQRQLGITFAESRAQVKEFNKIAEDTTKGIDERIAAAERANEIEVNLMAQRQEAAAEELRIAREQAAMSDSSQEDLDNLANLEIALINIRTESNEMQTTLQNKVNALHAERKRLAEEQRAQEEANAEALRVEQEAELDRLRKIQDAEQQQLNDRYAREEQLDLALMSEQEREIHAVATKYEKLFALSDEFQRNEADLMRMQREELAAIQKKYDDAEVAQSEQTNNKIKQQESAKVQAVRAGRQALLAGAMGLIAASAKTEKEQKKLAVANVLLNQGMAVANAVRGAQQSAAATGPGAIFTAPGFTATLVGIVLSTFAQIKQTLSQAGAATASVDTSMPSIPSGGGGGGAGGGEALDIQQTLIPSLGDLIASGVDAQALQAFVVQSQLEDQQALSDQITQQSTL